LRDLGNRLERFLREEPHWAAPRERAMASGRPVFVDFSADWCITCKTNERFAIDTPEVRQEFSKRSVILLKADWTNGDSEITQILKQHGRAGVPMYLLYPAGGKEPVVLPSIGVPDKPTPTGNFHVGDKIRDKRSNSYGFWVNGNNVVAGTSDKRPGPGYHYTGYPMPYWVQF
jgi:hypothetical protein